MDLKTLTEIKLGFSTKAVYTVAKGVLGFLLLGNILYSTIAPELDIDGPSIPVNDDPGYEERIVPMNQTKIESIQKACGSFGKLKSIQQELSINDLMRFYIIFGSDQSVKLRNDYVCKQTEEMSIDWFHSDGENICWPGASLQPNYDDLNRGNDPSKSQTVLIVDDPLIRLVKTWDVLFAKEAEFDDIHEDFFTAIKAVEMPSNTDEDHLITFATFAEFVAANADSENGHHSMWQPQVHACAPCHHQYDQVIVRPRTDEYYDRAVEELSHLPKSTLLRLFRLYYLDFIIFDIKLDLLKTVTESKDKRPEAELFRRKNSYWANAVNRDKYHANKLC